MIHQNVPSVFYFLRNNLPGLSCEILLCVSKISKMKLRRRRRRLCAHMCVCVSKTRVSCSLALPRREHQWSHADSGCWDKKNTGNAFAVRANDDEWREILSRRHVPLAKNHSFILGSWFGFNGGGEGRVGEESIVCRFSRGFRLVLLFVPTFRNSLPITPCAHNTSPPLYPQHVHIRTNIHTYFCTDKFLS